METYWLECIDSTQRYLLDELRSKRLMAPVCVGSLIQSNGKGSRGNEWIGQEGNLFISLAIPRDQFPNDLKLESSSIYFAYLMKDLLAAQGSAVWLKWPNDFYMDEKKIGGAITNILGNTVVCGIGINLHSAPETFGVLDIQMTPHDITEKYTNLFKNPPEWKQIFSKFKLEFERSRIFFTHHREERISLQYATLLEDGSLECDGQRIYSLR